LLGIKVYLCMKSTGKMKLIPLTRGKVAKVDDEDYPILIQKKWSANYIRGKWYAVRSFWDKEKKIIRAEKMHRTILGVTDKNVLVDHTDEDGLNNQKSNIRICTHSQNLMNRGKCKKDKSSKYKGVFYRKERKRWIAIIYKNKKIHRLGSFKKEIDAAKKYNEVAIKMHGAFAFLNKI